MDTHIFHQRTFPAVQYCGSYNKGNKWIEIALSPVVGRRFVRYVSSVARDLILIRHLDKFIQILGKPLSRQLCVNRR